MPQVLQSHVGPTVRIIVFSEDSMQVLLFHVGAVVRLIVFGEVSLQVLPFHVGAVVNLSVSPEGSVTGASVPRMVRVSVSRDGSVSGALVPPSELQTFALSYALETPGPGPARNCGQGQPRKAVLLTIE